MVTIERIQNLRRLCGRYGLEETGILDGYTDMELAAIYNGAGPDSWIPLARDAVTALMELFEPAALIHDTQFHGSDGLRESFEKNIRSGAGNSASVPIAQNGFTGTE